VPLALRVLRALRSPFEIDIYVWLTWRFFRLRRPVTISWASLALQFGSGYTNPRHFKKRFLGYLRSVIEYYPEVRLERTAAGLRLRPSPTHVESRPARRSWERQGRGRDPAWRRARRRVETAARILVDRNAVKGYISYLFLVVLQTRSESR
jgi:hypothetical protein